MHTILVVSLVIHTPVAWSQNNSPENQARISRLSGVNSDQFTEFAPSVSADGKTMIFESDREKGWKLFESKLQGKAWTEPAQIESINRYGRKNDLIGGPSLSHDGNTLYFFAFFSLHSVSEDIYYSVREGDSWSEPINMGAPINTDEYEGFPSISADGNTIYFIRINEQNPYNAQFDEPCFTIYRSDRDSNGRWTFPRPLPAEVNSGCERSPRIMPDSRTLVFSSIREGGKGNYDLYQTTVDDQGVWAPPVALDFVNSVGNDQAPSISASGDLMYYYSSEDIYSVTIPHEYRQYLNITVQGYVMDHFTRTPLTADFVVRDANSGKLLSSIPNNTTDGWYSLVLTKGREYEVEVRRSNYEVKRFRYDLRDVTEYREENLNVPLKSTFGMEFRTTDRDLPEMELDPDINVINKSLTLDFSTFRVSPDSKSFIEIPLRDQYEVSVALENYNDTTFVVDTDDIRHGEFLTLQIPLTPERVEVDLNVRDITNNRKIRSRITVRNKRTNEVIRVSSDETVYLRKGDSYEITAEADHGYLFSTTELTVDEEDRSFEPSVEMDITPVAENANLVLKGILFESNSASITPESEMELQRVIDLMKTNESLVIEISAHTDNVGETRYNINLSNERANAVLEYLISHNIAAGRLVSRGYGETRPLAPNDNEENMALNRRVELRVISY